MSYLVKGLHLQNEIALVKILSNKAGIRLTCDNLIPVKATFSIYLHKPGCNELRTGCKLHSEFQAIVPASVSFTSIRFYLLRFTQYFCSKNHKRINKMGHAIC